MTQIYRNQRACRVRYQHMQLGVAMVWRICAILQWTDRPAWQACWKPLEGSCLLHGQLIARAILDRHTVLTSAALEEPFDPTAADVIPPMPGGKPASAQWTGSVLESRREPAYGRDPAAAVNVGEDSTSPWRVRGLYLPEWDPAVALLVTFSHVCRREGTSVASTVICGGPRHPASGRIFWRGGMVAFTGNR